jgi:putative endonuclease
MWYVYILECSDNSFYTGHTDNLSERVERHNSGRGSSHTAARLPVKLVWHEVYEDKKTAIKRENQIKKWSRAKKLALINGAMHKLKLLSKKRNT